MTMLSVSAPTMNAAQKAWATRRARAAATSPEVVTGLGQFKAGRGAVVTGWHETKEEALAAFQRQADSDNPDWHAAALALKQALQRTALELVRARSNEPRVITVKRREPVALPAARLADYVVTTRGRALPCSPVLVVTFADGEVVRAPAVTPRNKPLNVGRGLRCAIVFWRSRRASKDGSHAWRAGRNGFDAYSARARRNGQEASYEVPEIVSCICEDTGERFTPELCNLHTVEHRKADRAAADKWIAGFLNEPAYDYAVEGRRRSRELRDQLIESVTETRTT